MAKRFIDTEMFNDSWFMDLSVEAKLFYVYLITNCDHAGIIDLNARLAEFQTGIKGLANSYQTISKEFGEKRMVHLGENYYFLPKFILFQYSKGLSVSVKAQKSVIDRLSDFNIKTETLYKGLSNSLVTVQDKDKNKDMDKDMDTKGGVGEKINFDAVYNTQWMEGISRNNQIDFNELLAYWEAFKLTCEDRDDLYRTADEYRRHFPNWLKTKLNTTETGLLKPKGILTD